MLRRSKNDDDEILMGMFGFMDIGIILNELEFYEKFQKFPKILIRYKYVNKKEWNLCPIKSLLKSWNGVNV